MSAFRFRLIAPCATFVLDMTDEEREIRGHHAAYRQPSSTRVRWRSSAWCSTARGHGAPGVVEADDENELRAFAARDLPVPQRNRPDGIGEMLAGFVRPR